MTLQSQRVTIVIAARIGQAPIYPQIGQGLLGGTIELVLPGDSVSQHKQLDELRLIFEREFDRGALSVDALKLELWQSHWYRASRQAMQRAADMLILAAANEIKIPGSSKLARECEGLAKVLDLFVNAQPADHPMGDALLRGEPVPDGLEVERLRYFATTLQTGVMTHADIDRIQASGLRADGIRPEGEFANETLADRVSHLLFVRGMSEAELARISGVPQPTVHRIANGTSKSPRYESVQAIAAAFMVSANYLLSGEYSGFTISSDAISPTALLTADESQALAEQIRSTAAAVEAVGNVDSKDESPFAVYEFPHEMYAALRQVGEILGGIREVERQGLEATPEMVKSGLKVLDGVDELLGRIDGESHTYLPCFAMHKQMVEEAIKHLADKRRRAQAEEMQAAIDDIRQQLSLEQHAADVTAKRTYQMLERLERGLMALAKAIGPMATDQMLAAMERPA